MNIKSTKYDKYSSTNQYYNNTKKLQRIHVDTRRYIEFNLFKNYSYMYVRNNAHM